MKKKIFYWSPFLVPIATPKAVVNSARAIHKYSKNYECSIINFFGEFYNFKDQLKKDNIKLVNHFNKKILKFFPKYGKFKSRLSFIVIFILSFLPLKKLITKEKPEFLIIHLITSLPLFLIIFFKFETRFILRISGLPSMGILRKFLWKLALRNIHLVTCPTQATFEYIKSLNIVEEKKIKVLFDPIIEIKKINLDKKKKIDLPFKNKEYFFAAGRLTKQKNFIFLCNAIKKIKLDFPDFKLVIAGDGEQKDILDDFIKRNDLEKNIFLIGFVENIFPYIHQSKGFILSSLWEDPGFVLVEAAFCRTLVLSSDCPQGPKEIIVDEFNGVLFESNNLDDLLTGFKKFNNIVNDSIKKNQLILNNLKANRKFLLYNHYMILNKILEDA